MGKITFTQKRIFDGTSSTGNAIIKYKALIYIGRANGEVWTYNPMSGRLEKITVLIDGASDSVRDFTVGTDGVLYAVTGGTDGKLFSYDNDGTWTELADTAQTVAYRVLEYNGLFYIGDNFGQVHVWDGSSLSVSLTAGASGETNMQAIGTFGGNLFVGGDSATAKIFEFNDSSWTTDHTLVGTNPEIIDFAEYEGEFYAAAAHDSIGTILRKNSVSSPQDWTEIHAAPDNIEYKAIEVFSGNLYAAGGEGVGDVGHTERYDGNQWVTINTDTTLRSWVELFADSDVIYALDRTAGASNNDTAMWALSPVCDDELFISEAMPFSFNLGTCDPTPDLCDVEDGCFCQITETSDEIIIQVEYSGPAPIFLRLINAITNATIIDKEFINTSGNFYEVSHSPDQENGLTIQLQIVKGDNAWQVQQNQPDDILNITRIQMFNSNVGIVLFNDSGGEWKTAKTTNGGETWVENTIDGSIASTFFRWVNSAVGWVTGTSNAILKSVDGGVSWVAQTSPLAGSTVLQQIAVIDTSNALIACSQAASPRGQILLTSDGGTNWVAQTIAPTTGADSFIGIDMFDASTGWAVGTGGIIYKTTDGGVNWASQVSGSVETLRSVKALSTSIVVVCGDSETILRTTNGGTAWGSITAPAGPSGVFLALDFTDATTGWIAAVDFVLITTDGGATFTIDNNAGPLTGSPSDPLVDISAVTTSLAFSVGNQVLTNSIFARNAVEASATQLAISECIEVKNNHDCDVLIKYTNDTDFAGIDYDGGFLGQIRIKAHFWRIQTPQTKTIHELSNEEIILTRQTVKKQVILETDLMPEYMHEKLSLIFLHGAVQIDDKEYVAEENYEYELGTKFRQVKGTVTLTERTYTKENIY